MKIIFIICFLLLGTISFSQEVLNDLFVNPVLTQKAQQTEALFKSAKIPLSLPFYDDFSQEDVYPSDKLWESKNVFINSSYAIGPPSIGVATFDAIDAHGYVYESMSETPSPADTLMSKSIDLSSADKDSTWLSFYYQPQGYGNAPEYNDSLILQFISNGNVYNVWYANGTDFKSFKNDSLGIPDDRPDTLEFKLVHLKLDKPEYFTSDFKLRFINYASITGLFNPSGRTNADHWNIDYIYLNDGRSKGDTVAKDLAMVAPPTLFMKNYSSVPWQHFESAVDKELTDMYFSIRNNDSIRRNINQIIINIKDLDKGTISDFYIGHSTIMPFYNNSNLLWNFTHSPIEWYEADKTSFKISGELKTGEADTMSNNYSSQIVTYDNYYAYDDGTAEKAYGVDADRAKVAYKYTTYLGDSLRAVQMYFVRNKEEYSSVQSFTLCVWDDYNGVPGNIILKETGKEPKYTDNLNEFVTIKLDNPVYLEGTFYIGWQQTSDLLMNVGFDANTIRNNRLFYFVNSQWYGSDFKGSLMMRPVFSLDKLPQSVDNNKVTACNLDIYPNPCEQSFTLSVNNNFYSGKLNILDFSGRIIYRKKVTASETINVEFLNGGIYLVTLTSESGKLFTTKLIISK
jgi:hypothetical protein